MKNINIKKLIKSKNTADITILAASIVLIYLLVSIYFTNHFYFNTVINGVDLSLKAHNEAEDIIEGYIKNYKLQLIERNGEVEELIGQDIGMQYNQRNSIYKIHCIQNPYKWISLLFMRQEYNVNDLYFYNKDSLENKIKELDCLNKVIIEPRNVSFKYSNGSYEVIEEIYGNKINIDKLNEAIIASISEGKTKLDLNKNLCYENPKYTLNSDKTPKTKDLLNKYVSA
jgi:vancomycin resistance protein YoaR